MREEGIIFAALPSTVTVLAAMSLLVLPTIAVLVVAHAGGATLAR